MQREDVLAVLKAHETELRARGVARVALFGSLARGDARPDSDVDLMVEIEPSSRIDLYDYVGSSTPCRTCSTSAWTSPTATA